MGGRNTLPGERFRIWGGRTLALGRLEGNRFTELENADDGADGTNSKLEFTLDADGEYVIRATSLFGNATGAYTLLLESTH